MPQWSASGVSRYCGGCGGRRHLDRSGDIPEMVCLECEEADVVRILSFG